MPRERCPASGGEAGHRRLWGGLGITLGLFLSVMPAAAGDVPGAGPVRAYLRAEAGQAAALRPAALEALKRARDPVALVRAALEPVGPVPSGSVELHPTGARGFRLHVALPEGYVPGREWPLVVGLHPAVRPEGAGEAFCASPALAPYRRRALRLCPELPQGVWDSPSGQREVSAVLDWAARELHADPDAVILTGYSLGGHGVWYLAGQIPDRIAAAVPLAGAPRHPEGLENARLLRLVTVNASADRVVEPLASAQAAARLRELGAAATSILTQGDHFAMDAHVDALGPYLEDIWRARRNPRPERLEWRGSEPHRHYWVEVREVSGPAQLRAQRTAEGFEIESEGVVRVALRLSPAEVGGSALRVVWNGQTLHRSGIALDLETLLDETRARPDAKALVAALLELVAPGVEVRARAM